MKKRYIAGFIGVVIVSATLSALPFYLKGQKLEKDVQTKSGEIAALNAEIWQIKGELKKEKENSQAALLLGQVSQSNAEFLWDKFDELNKVSLENDTESVALINVFVKECLYSGTTVPNQYARWNARHDVTFEKYVKIFAEIQERIEQLNSLTN